MTEQKQQLYNRMLEALKKLEWYRWRPWTLDCPRRIVMVPACPLCEGVNPDNHILRDVVDKNTRAAWGHTSKCCLATLIADAEALNAT